jgi:putative oxidoreductase
VSDILAMIGRVAIAAFFIWAGLGKLVDPAGTMQSLAGLSLLGPLPANVIYYGMIAIELGGGTMLLFGFAARSVAVILAAWCIATGVAVHLPIGDRENMINFYKNIAIAGGLMFIVAYGPGVIAVRGLDRFS